MSDREKYLRIAVRKFGPFEAAIQKHWDAFCNETECYLTLEAIPMDLPELHRQTLKDGGLKNGNWDVAHISSDWVQEAVATDSVLDLTRFLPGMETKTFFSDWPPSLLETQTIEQKIFGLPFHDGPECLIYRKDLFEDPAHKKAYREQYQRELAPPKNWEEFLTIASFFQRKEQSLYGSLFAAYPDRHNAVFDFCLQVWTRGGTLTNAQNAIQIDSEPAREGLAFYRKLFCDADCLHPQSAEMESVAAGEAFAKGQIAMMINWFGFASYCEFPDDSLVKGKIDVAPIPSGTSGESASLNSYWMYMVGRGSNNKQIAFDFIQYATNKENDTLLTKEGGVGCRKSTWHSEEINRHVPYFRKLEQLHENARTLPSVSYWPEIAIVIDDIMQKTIHSTENICELLNQGQASIDDLSNKYGN